MEKKADSPPAKPEAAEEEQEVVLKKGPWTTAEDAFLVEYVRRHGEGNWNAVRQATGLARCGKSCRLRWTNHLRPNLKKGSFSPEEELLIARLHSQLGNKWARMASQLPGRTDNEIKNYWNTRLKRRQRAGLPIYPPEMQLQLALPKRSRCEFSLSPPLEGNVQPVDAANATSAGYTSARPPPLYLAGQFAIANRPMQQLIAPLPFSAPSSPWANPLGPSSPLWLQHPRSSPVSPVTPNAPLLPVTPDLSLGNGMRSGLPPLSPSLGVKLELPSSQLRLAMPLAGATSGAAVVGGLQAPQNSTSLEAMMQELHDAMEDKVVVAEGDGEGDGGGGDGGFVSEPDSGIGNKPMAEPKEDIATLFGLNPTMAAPAPAPSPAASNPSGLHCSNSDEEGPDVDLAMGLHLLGGTSSTDQDWNLDVCQWNNMPGIC